MVTRLSLKCIEFSRSYNKDQIEGPIKFIWLDFLADKHFKARLLTKVIATSK